jgi:hypothetical protein
MPTIKNNITETNNNITTPIPINILKNDTSVKP